MTAFLVEYGHLIFIALCAACVLGLIAVSNIGPR